MPSRIVRRTSLALASAVVAATGLLATGGVAAAWSGPGDGSASTATSASTDSGSASSSGSSDGGSSGSGTSGSAEDQRWDKICQEVHRDGKQALHEATQGRTGSGQGTTAADEARLQWVWDQIVWVCEHR